jgi:RHS repeat-associated protein
LEADGRDQYAQVVVLNTSGALIGSQLYGPYGNSRSSSGTLPTSIGFTGQQTDSVTGLDYFNARYYDPVTGQFLSADVVQGNAQGTSPYRYVMGNPETRTDPTGQRYTCGPGNSDCSGGGGSSGGGNNGGGSGGSGGGSNPCELSGGNPEYCGGGGVGGGTHRGGGGGVGGGTHRGGTGGCHGGRGDGASAGSCTGTKTICGIECQAEEESTADGAAAALRNEAEDVQVWLDRLNSNESWYWLGILAGLSGTIGGVAGPAWAILSALFGAWSVYQARNDVVQILTMLRDMLNHVASDYSTEGETGWTATNILNFTEKEENYMNDQISQMENVDWLGRIISPIMIGGAINGAIDYVLGKSVDVYGFMTDIMLVQEGYLLSSQ